MKIGVLALQGDFAAHGKTLDALGCEWREVRKPSELDDVSGLILPGGESSTMLKFIREEDLLEPLRRFAASGKPMFGTCAGAILLARDVTGPAQDSLGAIDIGIQRNGYGRQADSFTTTVPCPALDGEPVELVFIRAPVVTRLGDGVETLLEHGGKPVLVRQNNILAATFHPELTNDARIHKLFVDTVTSK